MFAKTSVEVELSPEIIDHQLRVGLIDYRPFGNIVGQTAVRVDDRKPVNIIPYKVTFLIIQRIGKSCGCLILIFYMVITHILVNMMVAKSISTNLRISSQILSQLQ